MQAKDSWSMEEKSLLVDSLINKTVTVFNMLRERKVQLTVNPTQRKEKSQEGLKILYDLEMPFEMQFGNTLFLLAVKFNKLDIAIELAAQNANLNAIGGGGFTGFHFAAAEGYEEILNFLIEKQTDYCSNDYGDTPLHCAVSNGHVSAAEALLIYGAPLHTRNGANETPLDCVKKQTNSYMRRVLLRCYEEKLLPEAQPEEPNPYPYQHCFAAIKPEDGRPEAPTNPSEPMDYTPEENLVEAGYIARLLYDKG